MADDSPHSYLTQAREAAKTYHDLWREALDLLDAAERDQDRFLAVLNEEFDAATFERVAAGLTEPESKAA